MPAPPDAALSAAVPRALITGSAGFIGFHLARALLAEGWAVHGFDGMTDYYDLGLKRARQAILAEAPGFSATEALLETEGALAAAVAGFAPQVIVHLAAQAGVRYSLDNPFAYADSNLVGQLTVLEGCRHHGVGHLVYASSSSVYGLNDKMPFATTDTVDHPISLYAATKKANELMAHSYAHLYGIPTTGLRFFTVYGPWGRPDMALFKFTRAILAGEPIDVYNQGQLSRDFTHVDDIVEGIVRVADKVPQVSPGWIPSQGRTDMSSAPYRLFNIGNGSPVRLLDFIEALEQAIGQPAIKHMMPMQPGDVHATWADTQGLFEAVGYQPQMTVAAGVKTFVDWYRDYYRQA